MPSRALTVGLRLSTLIMVAAGFFSLASVTAYGVPFALLPFFLFLLMPIGERLDAKYPEYRAITRALTIAYGCFIPMTAILLGLMDAVIMLVIYVIAYTLAHLKQERNYYHLFLMSCFLLLAASVQSPEPIIGLVMILLLISAIWAFTTLRIYQEVLDSQGHVADQIRTPGPLSGKNIYRPAFFEAGFLASMVVITLASFGITILVFLVTPRIEAGMLGRSDAYYSQTGLSQSIDFSGGTFVQEDPTPVMLVEFPDEANGEYHKAPLMYWRNVSMPKYTGTQWVRRALMYHYEPLVSDGSIDTRRNFITRAPREGVRRVRQNIYLSEIPTSGLPALHLVQSLEIEGSSGVDLEWDRNRDLSIDVTLRGMRRVSYEAYSEVRDIPMEALQNADVNYLEHMYPQDYFMLTEHDLSDESLEIAESLMADQPTVFDKAMVVQRWLSSAEFLYTLDVPQLPESNAVDAFLNQFRRGHCELFASAMALMLRSEGIPTRVVSGYRGGEWDDSDQTYIVRANMAHLWVEVLFPEFGWVIFDPSPRSSDMYLSGLGRLHHFFMQSKLKAQMFWYREIEGYDRGLQLSTLQDLTLGIFRRIAGTEDPQARSTDAATAYERDRAMRPIAMIVATAIVLFLLLRMNRFRSAGGQWPLNRDQQRAVQLYHTLCRRLGRMGIACDGKTAGEIEAAAESLNGRLDTGPVHEVIHLYNDVRFGLREIDMGRYNDLKKQITKLRLRPEN